MKYQINIHYITGHSLHTEATMDSLELIWSQEQIALQNLKRIKEHFQYYDRLHSREPLPRPTWFPDPPAQDLDYEQNSIELFTDAGKIWKIEVFWRGYFERLLKAEIVFCLDDYVFEPG